LRENFKRAGTFAAKAKTLLGDGLFTAVSSDAPVDWTTRSIAERQRFLMTLVPKKIAHALHPSGWRVDTVLNYCYGGERGVAAMVTWIMEIQWDRRVSESPAAVYEEALSRVLQAAGRVRQDGRVTPL
jgi:hypothetical protein